MTYWHRLNSTLRSRSQEQMNPFHFAGAQLSGDPGAWSWRRSRTDCAQVKTKTSWSADANVTRLPSVDTCLDRSSEAAALRGNSGASTATKASPKLAASNVNDLSCVDGPHRCRANTAAERPGVAKVFQQQCKEFNSNHKVLTFPPWAFFFLTVSAREAEK